ncbi:predicted protein [Uncinocarpus reesii 1704]|uniref:Uncharacterized protein n=1 Tax=Uncinocarpus reesii (strain UAMH 1704) TaxID=336963 RepID=C4JT19_UNCRE|nr:uncharacterized protein UREG_05608 [Uncinocarpus reesii 1704]EEP80766.1 predicted protein [Uncinocarpus reesii 1704]
MRPSAGPGCALREGEQQVSGSDVDAALQKSAGFAGQDFVKVRALAAALSSCWEVRRQSGKGQWARLGGSGLGVSIFLLCPGTAFQVSVHCIRKTVGFARNQQAFDVWGGKPFDNDEWTGTGRLSQHTTHLY